MKRRHGLQPSLGQQVAALARTELMLEWTQEVHHLTMWPVTTVTHHPQTGLYASILASKPNRIEITRFVLWLGTNGLDWQLASPNRFASDV